MPIPSGPSKSLFRLYVQDTDGNRTPRPDSRLGTEWLVVSMMPLRSNKAPWVFGRTQSQSKGKGRLLLSRVQTYLAQGLPQERVVAPMIDLWRRAQSQQLLLGVSSTAES